MNISVTGLSHQTAPIALRERLAFAPEELATALSGLHEVYDAAAILSTCNRTEVYITNQTPVSSTSVIRALASVRRVAVPEGAEFYHLEGDDAIRHLFRVASGIESLVVGEFEILGQVRAAFSAATAAGSTSSVLARLFHAAIRAGRRARDETQVSAHGVSVSATAVALVRQALGDLRRKCVLIVGAGDAARLTAQALTSAGTGRILVSTRTFERARDIASELGALAYPFEEMPSLLREADIVISSTSAPEHVISRRDIEAALDGRGQRPLVLVDIAVPRDIDPAVAGLHGVSLFDIDDLQAQAEENLEARLNEVAAVEVVVEQEVERFRDWLDTRDVIPTIARLEARAENARRREVERTLARMPGLTTQDRKRLEAMTRAIVRRILHEPVTRLKTPTGQGLLESAHHLFGLDSSTDDS
jgi:glutamyl-tRNA reductase